MSSYQIIGLISGFIAVISFIPYFISIRRERTKPHPVTWVIWSVTGFVALVTYWGVGAHATLAIATVNFLGSCIIALTSLKYWRLHLTLFDYICLTLSLISIGLWLVLKNPELALTLSLFADFIAALPTVRKVYKKPHTESTAAWFMFSIATLISILAVDNWNYGVLLLPLYLFCLSLTIALLSLKRTHQLLRLKR